MINVRNVKQDIFFTLLFLAIIQTVNSGISSKMDFGEDSESVVSTNSSNSSGDDDVEVKHTIVVSTKLKNNNNRKGIHASNDGKYDKSNIFYSLHYLIN